MKIIYNGLISALAVLIILLTPISSPAQEETFVAAGPQINLEVTIESQEAPEKNTQLPDWIAISIFLFLLLSIPTLVSYGVRFYFQNTFTAYAGTYVFILMCYFLANALIEDMPAGDPIMVGLLLLVPSMIGSVIGQTLYFIRLPKIHNTRSPKNMS